MQATPLTPIPATGRGLATPGGARGATALAPVDKVAEADDSPGTAAASAGGARQRGLKTWNPGLQRQLADAQQAQNFLDQAENQLQRLKSELAARLAGLNQQSSQLEARLSQVATTWKSRATASAGSLDAQLRYSSPAPARQRFTVRGLDAATLQSGSKETLTFSVAGSGAGLMTVSVDPTLDTADQVRRFDRALAPAGIRAEADSSGAVVFSANEAAWPAVRDSLAIKGDGVRFPTGQLHQARTDAEPPAIRPESWSTQDDAALRQALQQINQALERIRQARSAVTQALSEAARQVQRAETQDDAASAAALAQSFESTGQSGGFEAFSSVGAALIGVSRTRVVSLLALPDGS